MVVLDDAVLPIFRALLDNSPGVCGEEYVVVVEVKLLRIPLGMIQLQPSRNVFSRLVCVPCLLDQIEATGPHRLPNPSGPNTSMEQLTLEEVEPQLPARHHP